MGSRRTARENALQMLYQWDVNHEDVESVVGAFWEVHPASPEVQEFAERLVRAAVRNQYRIDRLIAKHARNWRLERMETVDRNLLRLATGELLTETSTPPRVVINEAIEIARRYSSRGSPEFVNGLLDSILRDLETQTGTGGGEVLADT